MGLFSGTLPKFIYYRDQKMKDFIVYDKQNNILRTGVCQVKTFHLQANKGEFAMEGIADDATQKIEFDGFDVDGQPINPRVVDETPEEIEVEKLPEIPERMLPANVTNEQWQSIVKRIEMLEKKK